jgi:hypothetical protein
MAPIVWCITDHDKKMPVDAAPSSLGKFALIPIPDEPELRARFISSEDQRNADPYPGHLHRSHFETCPNADQHRKKGRDQ